MPNFNDETIKLLEQEKQLIFYKIMKYPIPKESQYFLFDEKNKGEKEKIKRIGEFSKQEGWFSWTKENPFMQEYRRFIDKFSRLYKSIPFVHSIYLCNSITFNALTDESDIDLFIVTKKWALWRARFFSELYFRIFFLKRGLHSHKRKKFCLSFYVTEDNQNLYNIMLPQNDIYFIYWLAHLVPLYQETYENIYKHNKWLQSVLPNFPEKFTINIGTETIYGKSRWKKFREFRCWWLWWKVLEAIIKCLRLPLVIYKKNKMQHQWRWIIINNRMLKFHGDIRKKVHLLYEVHIKKYREKALMK